MSLTKTPICDFGKKAENFKLNSTDNKVISLNDIKGESGTLIMFICNHCPYVKAVIKDFAPITQLFPILALFKITAPIPIKLLSPIVQP